MSRPHEARAPSLGQLLAFNGVDNIPDGRWASAILSQLESFAASMLDPCSNAPTVDLNATAPDVDRG